MRLVWDQWVYLALWDWFEIRVSSVSGLDQGYLLVRLVWDQWVYLLCETGLRSVGYLSVRLVWDQWVYLLCDSSSCSTTAVAQVLGVNLVDLGSLANTSPCSSWPYNTSQWVCVEGIAWYRWWPSSKQGMSSSSASSEIACNFPLRNLKVVRQNWYMQSKSE